MYFRFSDILYPRRCVICDGLLGASEKYVCAKCVPDANPCKDHRCVVCGRFTHGKENTICRECASVQHAFDIAFAPFAYEGKIRTSLLRFKYSVRPEYASFYAERIAQSSEKLIGSMNADLILHVPAHPSKIRGRGYDQALLLAKRLSRVTGIPHDRKLLKRKKKTKALASLSPAERRAVVRGAFEICRDVPKRIVLVDDIFTTGATADEISRMLKICGCREVYVLSAATAYLAC